MENKSLLMDLDSPITAWKSMKSISNSSLIKSNGKITSKLLDEFFKKISIGSDSKPLQEASFQVETSKDKLNNDCIWSVYIEWEFILCEISRSDLSVHLSQYNISTAGTLNDESNYMLVSQESFSLGSVQIGNGINYLSNVRVKGGEGGFPVGFSGENVNLHVKLPIDEDALQVQIEAVSIEYMIRYTDFDWFRIQPTPSLETIPEVLRLHETIDNVSLAKRYLSDGNQKIEIGLEGCPVNFRLINGVCWKIGEIPEIEIEETVMTSYYDGLDKKDLDETGANVVMFKSLSRDVETKREKPLPNINIYIKYEGHTPINVQIGRLSKDTLESGKIINYLTDSSGILIIDLPYFPDGEIKFRADFMKPDKWIALKLTDGLKRIKNAPLSTYQDIIKDPHNAKSVRDATNRIVGPSLKTLGAVFPSSETNSQPKLQKRNVRNMRFLSEESPYINEDDSVMHFIKNDESYPKSWQFSINGDRFEYSENIQELHKRNWFRDKLDGAHDVYEDFKETIKENIFEAASQADSFMVEKSEGDGFMSLIVRCIHKASKEIIKVVIKTLKDSVAFVKGIFHRMKVKIEDLLDKVRALFDFDDIKNTGRFLAHHMKNMVKNIDNLLDQRQNDFDESLKLLRNKSNAYFDEALTKFGERSFGQMIKADSIKNGQESASMGKSVQQNYVTNALINQVNSDKLKSEGKPEFQDEFSKVAKKNAEEFVKNANKLIPPEQQKEHNEMIQKELKMFDQGLMDFTMSKIVKFLKATVNLALNFVGKVRSLLTKYLKLVFRMFDRILSFRLDIPFITKFFESKVMRGKAQLNFYNLFALMGAVPATVSHKIASGGKPLLTTATVDVLVKTDNMNDYIKELVKHFKINNDALIKQTSISMSHAIGWVFTTSHVLYSASAYMNQLTVFPIRMLQGYWLGLLQFVIQLTSVPFNWELDYKSPAFKIRNQVWAYSLLSFVLHKGNPTLYALLVPPFLNSLFQTILAVPKLALLIMSLVTDINGIKASKDAKAQQNARIREAVLRYFGYTSYTLGQVLEIFALPMNEGLTLAPFKFNPTVFVKQFIFPPRLPFTVGAAVAQNVLFWFAAGFHSIRLFSSIKYKTAFLN